MPSVQQMWNRLSPQARTGVAVAGAGVAAVLVLKGRQQQPAAEPEQAPADQTSTDTSAGALPIGGTGAIGVDQLSAFESNIAEGLATLTDNINTLINKPAGSSTVPGTGTRAYKRSAILDGESADAAARRVRKTTPKTPTGAPITGAWLVHINKWKGNAQQRRWTGTPFIY